MAIPTVFETCQPRGEILSGELRDEMFAARLNEVVLGTAHPIYQDPRQFLFNTYPTARVKSFAREVLGRLNGQDPTASAFFRLDTPFGGGKTHALVTLYHLAQGNADPESLARFDLTADDVPVRPVRVVSLVGDDLDPANGVPRDGLKVRHMWGELAWQLAGKRGYEMVADSDREGVAPSAHFLRELVGDEPCLILVDEPAVYMRRMGSQANQLPAFLKTLSEWVTTSSQRSVLVLTLAWNPAEDAPQQDAFAKENRILADELRVIFQESASVVSRPAKVVTPAQESDIAPILKQRLFESVDSTAAATVAEAYYEALRHAQQLDVQIPADALTPAYRQRLEHSYPFHPEFIAVMDGKLATIPNFQRTRGALRLLSRVVRRLWKTRPEGVFAIHPFCVDLGDPDILDELSGRLDRPGFQQVARYDIAREDNSAHAEWIDRERFQGHEPYTCRIATTIFLHSLTEPPARGLDQDELMAATLTPGTDPAVLTKALGYLRDEAWHLDYEGPRYFFRTEPSINKIVQDETATVPKYTARAEVERRMRQLWKSSALKVIFFPNDPSDLDDVPEGRLVIPHWDTVSITDTDRSGLSFIMDLHQFAGTQQTYRRFRNTLFFLVADQDRTSRMLHNARRWLALEILTKDKQRLSNYKLSTEHQQRLNEWKGTADLEATISITRAYHDLFYPADSSDSRYKQLAHQPLHVESQGDTRGNQTELVLKALRDLGKVKSADDSPMAPALVKRDAFGKDEGRIKTAALFERFAERVKLPLFLEPTYLKTIIAAGVKSKEWIYYDITKDMGYDSAEDLPYIVIDENHEVLLPELAARETIRLYRKAEPQEQPPKPPEVKERPPGTSISESGEPRRLMTDLVTKATDAGWKAVTKVDIQWKGSGLETLARLKAVQTIKGRLAGAGLWLRTAEFSCQHNDGSEIAVTYKGTPAGFGTVVSMAEQQIKGATKSFASVALEVTYEPRIAIDGPDFDDLRDLLELADTGTTDMTIWKSDD